MAALGFFVPDGAAALPCSGQDAGHAFQQVKRHRAAKPCWFWERGCCQKGHSCVFTHSGRPGSQGFLDLNSLVVEPCWYFRRGCCAKGFSCPYSHEDFQQRLSQQPANQLLLAGPSAFVVGEEHINVPARTVKALIGPGGENIRLLEQVTGCRVVVEVAKEGDNDASWRAVHLHGIAPQRQQARALIQEQCEVETRAREARKMLMQDSEPLNDAIYTSVKVALSACEADAQEKEAELVKIRAKITHFARKSSEDVDVSGRRLGLEGVVRQLARNFFASLCQAYHEKQWLAGADFQLVLEAAVRELLPEQLLASTDPETLDRLIWESHDFALDEQRFLPHMWEIVRPLVDGTKTRKAAHRAFEVGRSRALSTPSEGSGMQLAEHFIESWMLHTLNHLADEGGGDPLALVDEDKLTAIFTSLLSTTDQRGASSALPTRLATEAGVPMDSWHAVSKDTFMNALATWRAQQDKRKPRESTSSTWPAKGRGSQPSSVPLTFVPPAAFGQLAPRPAAAWSTSSFEAGPSELPRPKVVAQRPPVNESSQAGRGSIFVRKRNGYGEG